MVSRFLFVGGHSTLDFLNTEQADNAGHSVELLSDPRHLTDWFVEANLPPISADAALLTEAHALRTAIRALVVAWTTSAAPPIEARDALNALLSKGAGYSSLQEDYTVREIEAVEVTSPLLPIASATLDLLTRHDKNLVRQCAGPGCVLWFLDTTKNKRRRWCRMGVCGNREKVAAHYQRHQQETG